MTLGKIIEDKKEPVQICLPNNFSTFCIIDGQHRLLAYTQDFYGEDDPKESDNDKTLQNLADTSEIIVTLVKFSGSKDEILKQQATLFRDINSNQTKVKTDFIYNLQEIIDPNDFGSIGNKVIRYLNNLQGGVLKDKFELKSLPSYSGRIKRSSIVKYGLRDLVELNKDFLYHISPTSIQGEVKSGNLEGYIQFCGKRLDGYFKCIKEVFEKKCRKKVWGKETNFMLLSTSGIVGFLRLYRHFIKSSKIEESEIKARLKAINVNFRKKAYKYTSSQWPKLEEKMFSDIRKKFSDFGDETLIKRSKK